MTSEQLPAVDIHDPVRSYLREWIKDDETVTEHVLVCCYSAHTPKPLNLAIMAPTSEGKTYIAMKVSSLFPSTIPYGGGSAKSFYYDYGRLVDPATGESLDERLKELEKQLSDFAGLKDERSARERASLRSQIEELEKSGMYEVDLRRRILLFLEPPDPNLWDALKSTLSHDSPFQVYQTVDKNSRGRNKTLKIRLVGWPVMIFCSAKSEDKWAVWPEIQSRFIVVSPTMTPEKYKHANRLTADLLGLPTEAIEQIHPAAREKAARDEVRRICLGIDSLLLKSGKDITDKAVNLTFNPWREQLADSFPSEAGSRMRQFGYLMGYAGVLTLAGADSRAKVLAGGKTGAVISNASDVKRALDLVLSDVASFVPRYKMDFLKEVIIPCVDKNGGEAVTVEELFSFAHSLGRRFGTKWLRDTILASLEEAGYVEASTDPNDKRRNVYAPNEIARNYGRLHGSTNFDPQTVKQSLKQLQILFGDQVLNFVMPDGSLAGDLGQVADFVVDADGEEPREDGRLQASEIEVRPDGPANKEAVREPRKDAGTTPTPPTPPESKAHLVHVECSECGRDLTGVAGGLYNWDKKPVCRDCFLGHAKERREAENS